MASDGGAALPRSLTPFITRGQGRRLPSASRRSRAIFSPQPAAASNPRTGCSPTRVPETASHSGSGWRGLEALSLWTLPCFISFNTSRPLRRTPPRRSSSSTEDSPGRCSAVSVRQGSGAGDTLKQWSAPPRLATLRTPWVPRRAVPQASRESGSQPSRVVVPH